MKDSILEKIYKSILKFLVATSPEETYANVVHEAMKLVGGDAGRIILEDGGELKVVYISSSVAELPKIVRKKGFTYTAFTEHRAFLVNENEIASTYPEIAKMGIKSGLLIPLSFRGKSIGVLIIESYKPGKFSLKELEILKLFGAIVSLKIRNVHLYNEVKKSLQNRDLFISLAAHELRTPITTIYGYSQLLSDKMKNEDSVEARWVNSLHAESYRLTLLIKDLLEINHIKEGTLSYNFKEASLIEIINRAANTFRFNSPKREIMINWELGKEEDKIIGDFDRLFQVVINLLDNAAKFSAEHTPIAISLKLRSSNFVLRVKDQGKGIPKKDLPKVFEGFYKGKDATNEGMGLGLFLVRNIIEAHRGTIHLHSRIGKGTLVEIQLPKARI